MHIVDIIIKIAGQHPEHRQELIDLVTLGYREGLITEKIKAVAEEEDMDPEELDESELLPQEIEDIKQSTENWFRELMMIEAKNMNMLNSYHNMLSSIEPREVDDRHEFMEAEVLDQGNVDLSGIINNVKNFLKNASPRNRVKADMDKLSEENPGLFD
jgi:hypothetical protein